MLVHSWPVVLIVLALVLLLVGPARIAGAASALVRRFSRRRTAPERPARPPGDGPDRA